MLEVRCFHESLERQKAQNRDTDFEDYGLSCGTSEAGCSYPPFTCQVRQAPLTPAQDYWHAFAPKARLRIFLQPEEGTMECWGLEVELPVLPVVRKHSFSHHLLTSVLAVVHRGRRCDTVSSQLSVGACRQATSYFTLLQRVSIGKRRIRSSLLSMPW